MCRILGLQADGPVDAVPWIEAFGRRCRDSQEFQGHGWGMSWQEDGRWQRYRSIRPIWKDRVELPSTRLVLVHARSAFRDEGIVVENNMPFLSGEIAFAFNGELHGVRLSAPGATGAARLLHLLERFAAAAGDTLAALARLDALVAIRSDYVRALNIVVSDGRAFFINTSYSEDQDYFTLHTASVPSPHGLRMVSSETISTGEVEPQWVSIPNHSTCVLDADSTCSS